MILLKKMGDTKKGIIVAVLISSAFFSSAHLINLFDESSLGALVAVIPQIIRTFAQGLFFAAIYLRSKTLLAPIFLHGLGRAAGGIFSFGIIFSTEAPLLQETAGDPSFLPILLNTTFSTLPFLIAGLILMRKVEPESVVVEKMEH